MTIDLSKIYNQPIIDLGAVNGKFNKIFGPIYDEEYIRKYLTNQFIEDANIYSKKYTSYEYWNHIISKVIIKSNLSYLKDSNITILDIGSGSGNTIFPLINLFPNADIIATDLSIELLALLKKNIGSEHNNIYLLRLNVEELDFKLDTFDIIIGGAVLHHLLNPEKTIEGVYHILKKEGCAIFFEPFENGNVILELAYREIINTGKPLSNDIRRLLKIIINDYSIRKGCNKSDIKYTQIDDKWLFTRSYFTELCEKYRFSKIIIYPIHDTEHQFENQTIANIRLGLNKDTNALPDWAWDILRKYDMTFSEGMKRDMLIEGYVIFIK